MRSLGIEVTPRYGVHQMLEEPQKRFHVDFSLMTADSNKLSGWLT